MSMGRRDFLKRTAAVGIAAALATGRHEHARRLASDWNRADGLFGGLDARRLPGE